jgi:hypothetical protein
MVSKSLKVVAIVAVLAVVISGMVYLILPPHSSPPKTASEAMILTPEEIGLGWDGFEVMPDGTSMPGETCGSKWGYDKNGSLQIWIGVFVFNSTVTSNAAFEKSRSGYASEFNCTVVSIGDTAIRVDLYGTPIYVFMRENVLCWTIDVTFWGIPVQPWHDSVLLTVIGLQLQKIDQYLVQHPGAS